jgi:hypothetical protein
LPNRSYASGDSVNITGITDSLTSARSEAYTYTASNRLQVTARSSGGLSRLINYLTGESAAGGSDCADCQPAKYNLN